MMVVMLADDMKPEDLGFTPGFFSEDDPRPAREQANANYQHGGGWHPTEGFTLNEDMTITYPGDPPMAPFAMWKIRNEMVVMYPYGWVMILQRDRSFEVARMD